MLILPIRPTFPIAFLSVNVSALASAVNAARVSVMTSDPSGGFNLTGDAGAGDCVYQYLTLRFGVWWKHGGTA